MPTGTLFDSAGNFSSYYADLKGDKVWSKEGSRSRFNPKTDLTYYREVVGNEEEVRSELPVIAIEVRK